MNKSVKPSNLREKSNLGSGLVQDPPNRRLTMNLPPELSDPIKKGKPLEIIKECANCPFASGSKAKSECRYSTHPKCDCKNPVPDPHKIIFRNFTDFGICLNCGHYIIKMGAEKWHHSHRYYSCNTPYSSESCIAPTFPK